jgi:hypothetical protein
MTGLTAVATIDIAYLYTNESRSHSPPIEYFGGHPNVPHSQQTSLSLDLVKLREQSG